MGNVNASHLSLLVGFTTLVATVIYYYKMVVLTELTTEATLFNTLYAEYATPQLVDALHSVEDFAHSTKLTIKQIVCKREGDRLWDKKLDRDWQRLHHWYQKIVYFHRMELLSDRFYKEFPGATRAKHFVQHVEPFALNACKYSGDENCSGIFDYLRELYALPAVKGVTCDGEESKVEAAKKDEL